MKNNRYLKSFLISFSIYFAIAAPLVVSFADTKTVDIKKDTHTITKISLSSVEVKKEPVVEEEPVEEIVKEKIVEKPAKKVVKKEIKKPKEKKPKKKPKKKVVQKEEVIKDKVITQDSVNQVKAAEVEDAYLGKIKHTIEKNKKYPRVAKRLRHEGRVTISFDILSDGKIVNIKIVENSRHKSLDKATIELLKNIAFFDAIPKELNKTVWNNIQVPVNYEIY